jgi:alpha-tubulin suppressor-like RCC1 family protein
MQSKIPCALGSSLVLLLLCAACRGIPGPRTARIAAGGNQTCMVDSGAVTCWGKNNVGQLGDGTNEDRNSPVPVTVVAEKIAAIAVGYIHACVLTEAGEIYCWGSQPAEQVRFGSDSPFTALAVGATHTCGLTSTGGMKCWGSNAMGGLGDGTTEDRLSPVEVTGLSTGVTSIAAGLDFSCAVKGGGVQCWGANETGQLGTGSYESAAVPAAVPGLESDVTAVAAGVLHACAQKTDGEIWCWGENTAGALGDGTNQNSPTPVKVINLEGDIQSVVVGGSHTCVLTKAGGVKCWGGNSAGQLGDGTTTDRNAPVDVAGLSIGVAAIAAGGGHTCAVLTTGAVKCWGLNENGQLGNGSNQDASSPVDVRMP